MELKFDEEGKVVVVEKDGIKMPVYVDKDGKDIEVNAPVLFQKISDVSSEAKGYRKEKAALKEQLKIFDGIEDLAKWKEDVDKNTETIKNLTDKELVDAGKVEEIKKQMKDVHAEEVKNIHKSYETRDLDYQEKLKTKDATIYNLVVSSKFAQSPLFSGPEPKYILPPEIAETYFGKHFRVEEGNNGLNAVGYLDKDTPIYSRKNPGELADFHEALETIVDNYPLKDRITRATGGGSGAGGGSGETKVGIDAEIAKYEGLYAKAVEDKDAKNSLIFKNKLFDLRQQKALGVKK